MVSCSRIPTQAYKEEYSVDKETRRLEAIAAEEARLAEEERQRVLKALDDALAADWAETVSKFLTNAGVSSSVIALLARHHRALRDLHAAFAPPPAERDPGSRVVLKAPVLKVSEESTSDEIRELSSLPVLTLRSWSTLTKWAGLVEPAAAPPRSRAQLNLLYMQAWREAEIQKGENPRHVVAASEYTGSGFEADSLTPVSLALPPFAYMLANMVFMTAADAAAAAAAAGDDEAAAAYREEHGAVLRVLNPRCEDVREG